MIERILWAISMFGQQTQKGIVEIRLEDKRIQVSIDEARDFAHSILEAAEGAETDEFLMKYLEETVGVKEEGARAVLLNQFRLYRDKRRRAK